MFASVSSINGAISTLWMQGLPDDYYQQYDDGDRGDHEDDVVRVAKKYIDLNHLAIVIVGDRASIQKALEATNIAPIVLLDVDGNRVDGK